MYWSGPLLLLFVVYHLLHLTTGNVHPDFRGRGVFQRLFRFLQEAGQQDPEVVGLRLYVENHNVEAQAVYERLGMREAGYQVREVFWRRAPARDV